MSPVAEQRTLAATVAERHIIVCTGAGGVGKTTTAASLALGAAEAGRRTIVLTIDPARRLAQSLGLRALDNVARSVPAVPGLDAMMLDMKRTFDELIERHAQSRENVQRIRSNRFYQQLSGTLAGTQEYMAMEKLYDLHQDSRYDCIVIDTPPTRNALDFLDAPKRLTDFLEGRFLKLLLRPGLTAGKSIGRAVGFGAGMFMKVASRLTGAAVLEELAQFFQSFEGMYEGFKQRAQATYHLLQSPASAFVVVTTPEGPPLREARYFLQRLSQDGMPTAGLVVNRVAPVAPASLAQMASGGLAAAMAALATGSSEERAASSLLRLHLQRQDDHERDRRNLAAALHGITPPALVEVPLLGGDVHDIEGLRELGRWLYPPA